MSLWNRYQPSASAPWDLKRVLHLHRRVVFGPCWDEVQRDLDGDPQTAVTRLFDGTCRIGGVPQEFETLAQAIGNSAVDSGSPERLKAWWLYRCLFSPRPLEERLTLMWHNHFATSNLKVNDLLLMKQQNDTLRKHACSPFGELLRAMSHDPALLQWLDAPSNRVGMPNENFARELMELFSLGIGNYSERGRQRRCAGFNWLDSAKRKVPSDPREPRPRIKNYFEPVRQLDRRRFCANSLGTKFLRSSNCMAADKRVLWRERRLRAGSRRTG